MLYCKVHSNPPQALESNLYAILSLANNMHIRKMVLIQLFILIGNLHLHGMWLYVELRMDPK